NAAASARKAAIAGWWPFLLGGYRLLGVTVRAGFHRGGHQVEGPAAAPIFRGKSACSPTVAAAASYVI
ncbi:MAG: hypothetical protein KDG56_13700, partial [Ottowia sp.]|nr:hypothetical protein [Ottowia sp.]